MKAFVIGLSQASQLNASVDYALYDASNAYVGGGTGLFGLAVNTSYSTLWAAIAAAIIADAATQSFTITAADIINWYAPPIRSETTLSLSVQTSTGAVGTQVSTTRDALVFVSENITTTANIAGSAAEDMVVEVAPTNSATAGDWIEKARGGQSQAYTLAIALQGVQVVKGVLPVYVPAGAYIKVRSTGKSGTTSDGVSSSRVLFL